MVRLNSSPTPCFWNCIGIAIAIFSVGACWSMIRANGVEIEAAHYKLKTTNALTKVQKVSDELKEDVELLPIASPKRQALQQELLESDEILGQAQQQIDSTTKQLIDTESEK
ncbi:hypothetical protein I4641_23280 [Waterburya agarophytonicola K14]|uniref:Uncharacterized protein n=1 Tax=Waterburya agarophytonicola KI4 TaxID=2874699 RepID=A0A964FLL3_9CYAN|nr:hypothetical protein [Waterburya agarophytonicola]MCC0179864.1 hypothetical protein [Waterburya agarophytonicola KI4]